MRLEDLEGIRQEADLMPHAGTFQRDERDALLRADGLDLRASVGTLGAQDGALELRRLCGIHVQWNSILPCRQDAPRMQHLRAAGGDLLRLIVMEVSQQPGSWSRPRIRAEHAGDVGPDLQALSAD